MFIIDSHTEGEPTRVILDGSPDLGTGSLSERAALLEAEHKNFYRSVVLEPYGQEAMVGALLTPATDAECVTGVIFFDGAAVIGMCGHGTIGVAATLAHMGRISIGTHKIETPVGVVEVTLTDKNTVTVKNVDSYRFQQAVSVDVKGIGKVTGDIAYGGNWFFMVDDSPTPVVPSNIRSLTQTSIAIREALYTAGIEGANSGVIDHIVLYGPALMSNGHSRNFVLCPDDAYDRSPCGTGCSARLACLAADNKLACGEKIYQESTIGSGYTLSYERSNNPASPSGAIIPSITGQAFITREATLISNPSDPLRKGIVLA
ncbi:4-hydroxyproline epimerase [Marinomonas sp.]